MKVPNVCRGFQVSYLATESPGSDREAFSGENAIGCSIDFGVNMVYYSVWN